MEGVGEMNKITKRRINIKRKESVNKKLAFQIIFSILIVSAVILTKQMDSNFSKQFLNTANEVMTVDFKFENVSENIKGFMVGVKNKLPFVSKDKDEFAAPVSGTIYQNYGVVNGGDNTFYNHGIDIVSNTLSVKSVSNGTVSKLGTNERLSNYIVVEEGDRLIIYGSVQQSFVNEGDSVLKGDILGTLDEENMKLHLEVWENGESVNPSELFKVSK